MCFQEREKTRNQRDQQGSHLQASVRHLGYSRLSGLETGRVVVMTSSFLPSTLRKQRFQTVPFSNRPLWRAFSD